MIHLLLLSLFSQSAGPGPTPEPYRVAAAHILVLHRDAFEPGQVVRDRSAARALARRIREDIRRAVTGFKEASDSFSEDRARRRTGGYLGVFTRGMLSADMRQVEDAMFQLPVGGISDVVESPLGFHILRRVPIREWKGSHILVQYNGCRKAPASQRRTEKEALAIARRLLREARKPGADFGDLARKYSDAPDSVRGGSLGVFSRHENVPELESAISSTPVGAVSGPVKSPLGYHLVLREAIRWIRIAEILVRPQGRTLEARTAALEEARDIRARAAVSGEAFERLARERSSHIRAKFAGDLGVIPLGSLPPLLERAAARLEEGQVSPVVETQRGFHILRRLPAPKEKPGVTAP